MQCNNSASSDIARITNEVFFCALITVVAIDEQKVEFVTIKVSFKPLRCFIKMAIALPERNVFVVT